MKQEAKRKKDSDLNVSLFYAGVHNTVLICTVDDIFKRITCRIHHK